jgi:hypothetical protein
VFCKGNGIGSAGSLRCVCRDRREVAKGVQYEGLVHTQERVDIVVAGVSKGSYEVSCLWFCKGPGGSRRECRFASVVAQQRGWSSGELRQYDSCIS